MAAKIKFVKRGASPVVTIPQADIGVSERGDDLTLINVDRQQESDLPREITVGYINHAADYQQGAQHSLRMSVNSINKVAVDMPIAMSDNEAKQIADALMFTQWTGRTSYEISVSTKYKYLEPSDVIQVAMENVTYTLLIIKKDEQSNGIIKMTCVEEDASVYSFDSVGGSAPAANDQIFAPSKTRIEFLDIALLRDVDDACGMYVACTGQNQGWNGCALFKSTDNGSTWTQIDTIGKSSHIGVTSDALPDGRVDLFDETNSFIVTFPYAVELSSMSEMAVLNGANHCVVGNEVIGFKNAEQIDAYNYRLSGLLRGRRGTEWATTTHAIGDRFVFLDSSKLGRLNFETSEIGATRLYKAVTIGDTLGQTIEKSFTFNNIGQECYSPTYLTGHRAASNAILIRWVRRTRIGGEWRDYVNAVVGEVSLEYKLEIWDNTFTTLKRTVTALSSESYTYSSADQTTDFGGLVTNFGVKVFQVSATMGIGYEAKSEITL